MKGLSKISLPTTKTALIGVSILAVIIVVIGTIFVSNSEIKAQKTQIALMQQLLQKNNSQIDILAKNNASQSAQIKALLIKPTPAIDTQYIPQPSTQNNTSPDSPTPVAPAGSASDTGSSGNTVNVPQSYVNSIVKNAFEHIANPGTITNCSYTGNGMTCTSN